ncbi:MAG: preprotein translocase subunit SecG [Lysobacter sp.]|nr:MAG: preprotein translocase subunit SecG [Lysobacter sp.]
MLFLNIIYVLLAIAMIALILMQRGAGAQAGSGFGGGASGTVFGSRGSANFLSKSTRWLAVVFFGLSLFMAWQAMRGNRPVAASSDSLMSQVPTTPAAPAAGGALPTQPGAPAASGSAVPTLPASQLPAATPSPAPQPVPPVSGKGG